VAERPNLDGSDGSQADDDEYEVCEDKHDYDDFVLNNDGARGRGGNGKGNDGKNSIYSSKHARIKEAQRSVTTRASVQSKK
jgi:hypothetical protein